MTAEMKLYERLRLDIGGKALFEPASYAAGVHDSGWLGAFQYDKVLFVIALGAAKDAATTIQFIVFEATDNLGTGVQPLKVTGAITAGVDFATYDELVLIHVDVSELTDGFTHLSLEFIVSAEDEWAVSVIPIRGERGWLPHGGTALLIVD